MSTLTAKEKKRITSDGLGCFPCLAEFKPLWLLRRNGPFLIGICLDRDSSNDRYCPVFHFHNLLLPKDFLTLTLAQPLRHHKHATLSEKITVDRHGAEFSAAAERFAIQCPLLVKSELSFSDVYGEYIRFLKEGADITQTRHPLAIYLDLLSLCKWFGFDSFSNELLGFVCEEVVKWPKQEFAFDIPAWRDRIWGVIGSSLDRERILGEQLIKHKLGSVPDFGLRPGAEPDKFWRH